MDQSATAKEEGLGSLLLVLICVGGGAFAISSKQLLDYKTILALGGVVGVGGVGGYFAYKSYKKKK